MTEENNSAASAGLFDKFYNNIKTEMDDRERNLAAVRTLQDKFGGKDELY